MADTCPKCGRTEVDSDTCPGCGVTIATYRAYLEKLRQGPRAAAQRGTTTVAAPPAGEPIVEPLRPAAAVPKSREVFFFGGAGTLLGMQIVNALLTMVTFGIYYFWGKVKVRKYLFSETEFEGDRFEYHGTGKDLYVGAVKATLIFFLPIVLLRVLQQSARDPVVRGTAELGGSLLGLVLVAVAIVGSRRYRLSRTSWRGIRFSFRGRTTDFIKLFVTGSILSLLTLSFYTPVLMARQYAFLTTHAYFGSAKFGFDGNARALLWPYVKFLLLLLPTLGLSTFWYLATQQRYFWNHTTFGEARFRSTVTGGGLLKLQLGNIILLLITLGFAWPWVTLRKIRYRLDNLRLDGPLDLARIEQQAQDAPATGETVASFLDLDLIG